MSGGKVQLFYSFAFALILLVAQGQSAPAHAQSESIEDAFRTLLYRSRFPGPLGPAPSQREILGAETELRALKLQVEEILASPSSPLSPTSEDFVPLEMKLSLISEYFDLLDQLILIRKFNQMGVSRNRTRGFSLRLARDAAHAVPIFSASREGRIGSFHQRFQVSESADQILLELSPGRENELEIASRQLHRSKESHHALLKIILIDHLLRNYNEIGTLLGEETASFPVQPTESDLSELPFLENFDEWVKESSQISRNRLYQQALAESSKSILSRLTGPLHPILISRSIHLFLPEVSYRAIKNQFEFPSRAEFTAALAETQQRQLVEGNEVIFSSLISSQRDFYLRRSVADALHSIYQRKTWKLIQTSGVAPSEEQIRQISNYFTLHIEKVISEIPASELARWTEQIERDQAEKIRRQLKGEWIQKMRETSEDLYRATHSRDYLQTDIDPIYLPKVFESEIRKISPRSFVIEWLQEICQSGDYLTAKALYEEILLHFLGERILSQGAISTVLARRAWESRSFTPAIPGETPLLESIRRRMGTARRKDVSDFIEIGALFGFHQFYESTPDYASLLKKRKHRELLVDTVQQTILNSRSNPILNMKVDAIVHRDGSQERKEIPLYHALARARDDRAAEGFLDTALRSSREKLLKEFRLVLQSRNSHELTGAIRHSLSLGILTQYFPQYHLEQEKWLNDLLSPSPAGRAMDRLARPYYLSVFSFGLVSELGRWGIKKMFKRQAASVELLYRLTSPYFKNHFRAAMGLLAIDLIRDGKHLADLRRQKERMENLFHSSVASAPLPSSGEIGMVQSRYQQQKWMLIMDGSLELAFGVGPLVRLSKRFPSLLRESPKSNSTHRRERRERR